MEGANAIRHTHWAKALWQSAVLSKAGIRATWEVGAPDPEYNHSPFLSIWLATFIFLIPIWIAPVSALLQRSEIQLGKVASVHLQFAISMPTLALSGQY